MTETLKGCKKCMCQILGSFYGGCPLSQFSKLCESLLTLGTVKVPRCTLPFSHVPGLFHCEGCQVRFGLSFFFFIMFFSADVFSSQYSSSVLLSPVGQVQGFSQRKGEDSFVRGKVNST